jgi:hypothetical protein
MNDRIRSLGRRLFSLTGPLPGDGAACAVCLCDRIYRCDHDPRADPGPCAEQGPSQPFYDPHTVIVTLTGDTSHIPSWLLLAILVVR